MRSDYRTWLEQQRYDAGTITSQLHRVGRVEKYYGDLDQHFGQDRLETLLAALKYTSEDKRRGRPNPSKIPFDGDAYNNLASYRNAVALYRRFIGGNKGSLDPMSESGGSQNRSPVSPGDEDAGQRLGLERDLQATLRRAIGQLDPGFSIVDDGTERAVDSGFIDITAQDADGALVVIELKAGVAGQRAVAQILSYMGDVAAEEGRRVRGILVAAGFDSRAKAAARIVPSLSLVSYVVRFQFAPADD